ncbi:MAG: lipopolysaccharide biosynthesis protein, partial [Roseiflexus sp.]|nr:lipopolysaccharide biosynthesis protein [Roseiflexus sp.]MBO9342333.1 lipopolysaccharide biosynthesis protein [Roseiflexus sp.]
IDTSQSPEADRIIITPPPDNDVPHNEERRVIVPPPEAVARMSDETDAALVGQVDQSQDVRVLERSVNDQEMPESGAPLYPERVPSDQQPGLSRRSDMSREAKAPSSTAKARRSGRARNRRHSKKP